MPIYLFRNFDYEFGNFASFVQLGASCFFIVILIVNMKMFTFQSEWTIRRGLVVAISVGSWILIATLVSVIPYIDHNFFGVSDFLLLWLAFF